MAEFWGWCTGCARWFYASSAAGGSQPDNLACPVCMSPPGTVELRETTDEIDVREPDVLTP